MVTSCWFLWVDANIMFDWSLSTQFTYPMILTFLLAAFHNIMLISLLHHDIILNFIMHDRWLHYFSFGYYCYCYCYCIFIINISFIIHFLILLLFYSNRLGVTDSPKSQSFRQRVGPLFMCVDIFNWDWAFLDGSPDIETLSTEASITLNKVSCCCCELKFE